MSCSVFPLNLAFPLIFVAKEPRLYVDSVGVQSCESHISSIFDDQELHSYVDSVSSRIIPRKRLRYFTFTYH